ncbi:MAG: HAD-IIB family hydrolase [Erysipelotrichaceae bacterium]|nr:HAD-IIB family hydrolase [Erysipelotrichaceae bacterium]
MNFENMKAFIADIDGTLVTKGNLPGPKTIKALQILHEHGIQLGIASGRVINTSLRNRFSEWGLSFAPDVLIGMNGGEVEMTASNEFVSQYALSPETLKEIMGWMKPTGLIASVYEGDHMVATAIDAMQAASMKRNHMEIIDTHGDYDRLCVNPVHTVIYRYYEENKEAVMNHIADYLSSHPDVVYTSVNTFPGIVEIIHKNCNKGEGVKVFSKLSKIAVSDIVCMGDMDNDLGLMRECGIGIAMANGSETMKKAADEVTEYSCDEDGAGRFLFEKWISALGW